METALSEQLDADSAPTADQRTELPSASGPSFWARCRRFLWPGLCLLQFGFLVGEYILYKARTPSAQLSAPSETPEPPKLISRQTKNPSSELVSPTFGLDGDDLEHGERLIRLGRIDLALALFQALESKVAAPLRDLVQYRVALCLERLERWDEASAAYQALTTPRQPIRLVAAAEVGQARVAFQRGLPEETRDLMCRMLLHSAQYSPQCSATLDEARFLLALALTWEAGKPVRRLSNSSGRAGELASRPTAQPGPARSFEDLVEAVPIPWSIERALRWADPPSEAELSAPPVHTAPRPTFPVAFVKVTTPPEESLIQASLAQVPIQELLDGVASKCGFQTKWTAKAIHQVTGRQADADADNIPFWELVRNLASPLQLVWKLQDGVLSWSAVEETPAEALTVFRLALARRALRDVVVSQPGHELTPVALLYLGNLEVEAGQLQAAAGWYERLVQENQRSPVLIEANYNLGIVQRRLGNDTAARKAFFRVVDLAPGQELAAQAYLMMGRIWLAEGEPARAIPPLRRAAGAATGSPTQAVSAVSLAASYLWVGTPQAANDVLRTYRVQVNQPRHQRLAAFLDAFSRFRAAAGRGQTRHASDLFAAMLNVGEESYLKSLGELLIGQAYRELGMVDQLAAVYQRALPHARGAIAEEMAYSLAEADLTLGKRDEAKRLLLPLTILQSSRWASAAKFRLAEIALQESRSKEALLWCRQLLPAPAPEMKPPLLELMGRAFEQNGDLEQAARCFRGEPPK